MKYFSYIKDNWLAKFVYAHSVAILFTLYNIIMIAFLIASINATSESDGVAMIITCLTMLAIELVVFILIY